MAVQSRKPTRQTNKIFLIHGRNHQARDQFEHFLVALGLVPVDLEKVRMEAPSLQTILQLVKRGMDTTGLVIALLTDDEWASLHPQFRGAMKNDTGRWQSRPNVIFELGYAIGTDESRVAIVVLGTEQELPSDAKGLHVFRPTNDSNERSQRALLRNWLTNHFAETANFMLSTSDAWKTEGDFNVLLPPRTRPLDPLIQRSAGDPLVERAEVAANAGHTLSPAKLLGDAVELGVVPSLTIEVTSKKPYIESLDEYDGTFRSSEELGRLERWLSPYKQTVCDFIRNHIDQQSSGGRESCKVGVAAFRPDLLASGASGGISVLPLNHLVTTAFNRKLASERLKRGSLFSNAHDIWAACMREALSSVQGAQFLCPSQLFAEFIVITRDKKFPITQKSDRTSVYAARNSAQPVKTCGFEFGPNWQKVIREGAFGGLTLDFKSAAEGGLKSEYPMPDWESRIADVHFEASLIVLQTLHLNTAIVGICIVPYSSSEMLSTLRGRTCGGMDHANLEFADIDRAGDFAGQYDKSVEWHGTAIARLNLLARNLERIRNVLDSFSYRFRATPG